MNEVNMYESRLRIVCIALVAALAVAIPSSAIPPAEPPAPVRICPDAATACLLPIATGTLLPTESPGTSPYALPADAKGLPEGTLWTIEEYVGPSIRETPDKDPQPVADDVDIIERQEVGYGHDFVGIYAKAAGCDGWYWWAPGVVCQYPYDDSQATGVLATIEFRPPTLNGDTSVSRWVGLRTSTNDFMQVGYTRGTDTGGADRLFVQIYYNGHFSDSCGSGWVVCYLYNPGTPLVAGNMYTFSIKSGYQGTSNYWGFYFGTFVLHSASMGSSHSGSNLPHSFVERTGSAHNAYVPETYWDCGLCLWQAGDATSHGATHGIYRKEGTVQCSGMGEFRHVVGAEFYVGDGTSGWCPANNEQVW